MGIPLLARAVRLVAVCGLLVALTAPPARAQSCSLAGWGRNAEGQISVPAGTFTAVAAGTSHSLAIRSDGTLAGWGYNPNGETTVPTGTFTAVAAGYSHSLAIRSDGTLAGWGLQTNVPPGTFVAVAAGSWHSLAIRNDGTLVGWGRNLFGETTVPSGTFIAVAAGEAHSLAVRSDGTLVGWGRNFEGQTIVPAGTFTAVAAGAYHSLAIRTNGTLVGWGENTFGQINVPAGTFTAVAGGYIHSLAIRSDGTLVGWGYNAEGQINVPAGTFTAVAAGESHSLAIQACPCTLAGSCDNFALPTEPTVVSPALAAIINANLGFCNSGLPRPFDAVEDSNCYFGYSFQGLSNFCCPAELTIHLKAGINDQSNTDSLSLGIAPVFVWGLSLNALDASPLCTHAVSNGDVGNWSGGEDMTCVLDLCNLPPDANGTTSVETEIRTQGTLDVFVQDETGVDCIDLCNNICPCIPPPSDLAHWWPLDETGGLIAHDINAGHNGNAKPGAIGVTGPTPVVGKVAGAFSMGGSTSRHVNVPNGPLTLDIHNPPGFTIDFWYQCSADPACGMGPGKETVVSKVDSAGVGYSLDLGPGGYCWALGNVPGPGTGL